MFYYHTFKDLEIEGIYDHEPILSKYHFPDNGFFKGKKILDIGCASGFFTKYFAERGSDVVSVDINVDVMNIVKKKSNLSNVEVIEKDVYDLHYENEFDMVFCGSLLMHVFYPMDLLKIIYKSLKLNGKFVLCTGGVNNTGPVILVEKYLGRNKGNVESEIRSANESLWWLSVDAGINMLHTVGFKNISHVDSFVLSSTSYGINIGHNYSSLHHVWNAVK